ncbi:uncharacterized protein LOC141914791 [Tubulanus polymorphus]|uniref:uncharacterized protein LOC141914791 n=1 Tax=Tubulanus polymorphus TaxID=672921 RepID=UPI003DA374AD
MRCHKHQNEGWQWMQCTLCRSLQQGLNVYHKAKTRKVEWPSQKNDQRRPIQDAMTPYTTLDDAFSSIFNYMSMSSRQCKRFYNSCSSSNKNRHDNVHCNRFHSESYRRINVQNPLQMAEDVHVVLEPGAYTITAGSWGTQNKQQTHVVRINDNQSVDLDFVI